MAKSVVVPRGTVYNHANAWKMPRVKEKSFRPSKTVPELSMALREILKRYTRGLSPSSVKVPVYDDEPDLELPDPLTLDLHERAEMRDAFREELNEIRSRNKLKPNEQENESQEESSSSGENASGV